jgi:hypothetical protein
VRGGLGAHPVGYLLVADQRRLVRCRPGTQQPEIHPRVVHRRHGRIDRQLLIRDLLPGPPAKRLENVIAEKAQRRVLHPDVDDHVMEPASDRVTALSALFASEAFATAARTLMRWWCLNDVTAALHGKQHAFLALVLQAKARAVTVRGWC